MFAESSLQVETTAMAYDDHILASRCGFCDAEMLFTPRSNKVRHRIRCGACTSLNHFKNVPLFYGQANLPERLLVGADHNNLLEVTAIPQVDGQWDSDVARDAPPYSVRSFVIHASKQFKACEYSWGRDGLFGSGDEWNKCSTGTGSTPCHLMSGFSLGQRDCPLWQKIADLCQTSDEKWFLHQYLRYVRGRPFPMLIPQCRLGGITQSIRPDFVAFVPLQMLRYRWLAIQLDAKHSPAMAKQDEDRDARLQAQGYEVRICRGNHGRYVDDVKRLVEDIERIMAIAASDPASVAVPVTVVSHDPPF